MSQKEVDAWREAEKKILEGYGKRNEEVYKKYPTSPTKNHIEEELLKMSNGLLDAIEKMREEDLMDLSKQPKSPQQPYNQNPQANINQVRRSAVVPSEAIPSSSDGHKESNGKQEFELDWDFIESMAKRMAKNKTKYGRDNWKKPMDIESLKQALFRHCFEIMKGNYPDDGDALGHLPAIALNAMFLFFQVNNQHK